MATQLQDILRLRYGQGSEHLLLNISRKGPNALDLELVATDRADVFKVAIKEASIASLQAANFAAHLGEWKSVLEYVLLHQRPEGPISETLQGVEALAAVSGTTATITLRRNIGGITQKLGTINLEKDDNLEIDTLEWVDAAAKTSNRLRTQLDTLQDSVISHKDQIAQLTARLDTLVRAKKEHEDELLSKFAALLNTKKLKIRDQQRLLAGAQIDPNGAEDARRERSSKSKSAARGAAASRKGKRKANEELPPAEEEDLSDDQDGDQTDEADADEDGRRQLTPETEDEEEEEEEATADDGLNEAPDRSSLIARPSSSQTTGRVTRQSQHVSSRMEVDAAGASSSQKMPSRGKKEVAKAPTPPPTSTANNDEDDDTEDEL